MTDLKKSAKNNHIKQCAYLYIYVPFKGLGSVFVVGRGSIKLFKSDHKDIDRVT